MEKPETNPAGTRRRASWLDRAGRCALAIVLVALLVQAARQAIASALSGRKSLAAIRQAERWDPSNPDYPAQLGRTLAAAGPDADPQAVARAFEDAVRIGPNRAENWASLGEALDMAGNVSGARRAYQRALEIFPRSPAINWQFANFLIRGGDAMQAMAPLRLAMEGDPSLRTGAFDIAWRAGMPPGQILQIIPARQAILSAYLDYLVATGRLDPAANVWQRLLASPQTFDLGAAFRYFDALLYAHRAGELAAVWAGLARHDPARIPPPPAGADRITNGGFEAPAVNGGFGWRITPMDGADVWFNAATVHSGARSLLVQFEGKHNLDFGEVAQYVPVEPNTRYRFTAYTRCEGITTDSGPHIAVYDPYDHAALWLETENLTGTTEWQEQTLEFKTGPKMELLVVQVLRLPSGKFDNQIAGMFWLDDVSLTAVP